MSNIGTLEELCTDDKNLKTVDFSRVTTVGKLGYINGAFYHSGNGATIDLTGINFTNATQTLGQAEWDTGNTYILNNTYKLDKSGYNVKTAKAAEVTKVDFGNGISQSIIEYNELEKYVGSNMWIHKEGTEHDLHGWTRSGEQANHASGFSYDEKNTPIFLSSYWPMSQNTVLANLWSGYGARIDLSKYSKIKLYWQPAYVKKVDKMTLRLQEVVNYKGESLFEANLTPIITDVYKKDSIDLDSGTWSRKLPVTCTEIDVREFNQSAYLVVGCTDLDKKNTSDHTTVIYFLGCDLIK